MQGAIKLRPDDRVFDGAMTKGNLAGPLSVGQRRNWRGQPIRLASGEGERTIRAFALDDAEFFDSAMKVRVMTAYVPIQLAEFGFVLFQQHRIDARDHHLRFEEAATPDIPLGVDDGVEENVFEFAMRRDVIEK